MGPSEPEIRRRRPQAAGAERKQLEAIAHLYLPPAAAPVREHGALPGTECAAPRNGPRDAPFVVCFAAGRDGLIPALGCLYNLGLLLQVCDGPVLLAGSREAYRARFSFGFRPDRERFGAGSGIARPGVLHGPLDLHLARAEDAVLPAGPRDALPARGPSHGGAYRYVLTDDLSSAGRLGELPGTAWFVVTPWTDPGVFAACGAGPVGRLCLGAGRAGVLTAGTGNEEEGAELFGRWKEVLTACLPEKVRVEHAGTLQGPLAAQGGDLRARAGMRVLEAPASPEARWFKQAAARVRSTRAERCPGALPVTRKGRLWGLVESGVFASAGFLPVREAPGPAGSDGWPLLVNRDEDRLMVPEWVARGEDVNLDRLLARYLLAYERLNRDAERGPGRRPWQAEAPAELPGIVLVLEERRDVRRMERVLKLVWRIPVEVYSLGRDPDPAQGGRPVLERQDPVPLAGPDPPERAGEAGPVP